MGCSEDESSSMDLNIQKKCSARRGSLENSSDDNTDESERLAIIDLRAQIREREEAQRQKFLARQMADDLRLEQRQVELEEKQVERETKRRKNDDRRRQIICEIQQSERSRNVHLLQKWEVEDRRRRQRIEKTKKQQTISVHRKLLSKWNERRKYQEKRLTREAERREQIHREKQLRVENRKNKVKQQWRRQEEALNSMRCESALKRQASTERYEKRMSRLMAIYTLSDTDRRSKRQSPYRSLWVLERVLKRLHFPDMKSKMSKEDQTQHDELWSLVNGIIDNAVETLKTEGAERELQILREGAQAVVQWTMEKIMIDNVPNILKSVDEDLAGGRGDDGSEGQDSGSFETKEVNSSDAPSSTVKFTTLVDSSSDILSGEDLSETPSASNTDVIPTTANLELRGKSLTVLKHSFMRLEQDLPEDTVMETRQALSNLNLLLDDILNDRCSRFELEQIVEYAAGRKESNTNNIVDIILENVLTDLKEGRFAADSLTRLVVPLVNELEGERMVTAKPPVDAQYLLLSNIINQFVDSSLSNNQLKFLVDQVTSLFRGPELDISSKLLQQPIQCLINGGPSTKDNIVICKALAGKVLKDLVYWMGVGEKKDPQVITTVVCKSLTALGEHMSEEAQKIHDLFGISVIADNILDNAMESVALESVAHEGPENDKLAEPCVSLLVHSVVKESLAFANPLQNSQLFGKDIQPPLTKILSNVFSHSATSTNHLNPDEKEALNFSQAFLADVMRHFANIISKSKTSTILTCITEEEYLWAKTVVEDVFREMARQMASYNTIEKPLAIEPGGLMEQIVIEMDEYTILTFPSPLGQNLLPHEVSHISLTSVVETMKRMVRLFPPHNTTKKNKKAKEIVFESFRHMWANSDIHNTTSTASFAKRIANEMQRQFRSYDRMDKQYLGTDCKATPHPIVINTILDLKEILAGFVDDTDSVVASLQCVNHETKSIIHDTFTHLVENMTQAEQESEHAEISELDTRHMIVCESLRLLMQTMLLSASVVQDCGDLESSYAASHYVRQTLQHLSEAIMRSLDKKKQRSTRSTINPNDTKTLEDIAKILSESSIAIGDKQNLTERKELRKLTAIITNKINTSPNKLSQSEAEVVFNVLDDIVDNMFSDLSKEGKLNADTLVLAGRIVNDILDHVSHTITTSKQSEINIGLLQALTNSWPTIFGYVATYKFKGYGVISGNIVKELLNLITSSSIYGSKFCGTSQCHIVMSAVANIFNRLVFTAMSFVQIDSHWVDFEILDHLSGHIAEDKLSLSDLDGIAISIISSFTISTLPFMNANIQIMMRKFLVKLMEKVGEDVEKRRLTEEDLCNIGKQVEEEDFPVDVQYIIRQIIDKTKSNQIGESRLYECLGVLLDFMSKSGSPCSCTNSDALSDFIETVSNRFDANGLTKDDEIFIAIGMFKVVYAMNIDDCEYQFSLPSFMTVMWSVTQLNRFTLEIEDECLPCSVAIHVVHVLSTAIDENGLEKPDPATFKTEESTRLIPAYKDMLLQMLNRLSDGSVGKRFARKLCSLFEHSSKQVPVIDVAVPFLWKEVYTLLAEVTKSVATLLGSGVSTMMSFGPIRISCNPNNISIMAKCANLYQLGIDREHPSVRHIVTVALNSLMTCADFGSHEDETVHSPLSLMAQDLVDEVLLNPNSKSTVTDLSQEGNLSQEMQPQLDQNAQLRTTLVSLSKTYRKLKEVIFHPSAYVRHYAGLNVRRALLSLIKDIDLQRFQIDDSGDLMSSLMKWWNEHKSTYETSQFDNRTKEALVTLVDQLKSESKIIGPPRKNEHYATVKITEQRVRAFMKRIQEENPELLKTISQQNTASACSIIANDLVGNMLNSLDTQLSQDSICSSADGAIVDLVDDTLKQLELEQYTDYIAERVTTEILENISYSQNDTGMITVAKVKSFLLPYETKDTLNAPSSQNLQKSSCSGLNEFVDSLLKDVKENCQKSDSAEQIVESLMQSIQIDKANSDVAEKMIENLIAFLKKESTHSLGASSDNPLTIDPSELARKAVDSVLRLIAAGVADGQLSGSDSQAQTGQGPVTEQPDIVLKTCSVEEDGETEEICLRSEVTPSVMAADMVDSKCSHLQTDKESEEDIIVKSNAVSKIADIAVQSLVDMLESSDPSELAKMDSFVKKIEGKDSDLIAAISAKSQMLSPSASVTEPVVHMIIAALEKEPNTEAAGTTTASTTSDIAAEVVSSIIKLMNRSVSPDNSSKRPKSAQIAVQSLVDAMERDLQIAQQLKRSTETNVDLARYITQQANSTIQRVKDILLRIIQDVSASHLTTDQIENIASTAAGEMMKTFTFEPLSNAKTSTCSSPIVNEAVKTLVKDIEDGYYTKDSAGKESYLLETKPDQPTGPGDDSNQISHKTKSTAHGSPEESMSDLIKDALNYILLDVKTASVEASDVFESAKSRMQEGNNKDRIQTWISNNQTLENDGNLTELIAKETLRTTSTLIKENAIPKSDIHILAETMRQRKGIEACEDNAVDTSELTKELDTLLLAVERKGLTSDLTHTLVKTILNIVVEDTQQNTSGSSKCDVATFLSKILCHLLTSTDTIEDDEMSETATERDSFVGMVVTPNENIDHPITDVKIEPTQCGQPLHVDTNVTSNALSAISIRGHSKIVNPHEPIARNSFRDLHHPDVVRTEVLSHDKPEVVEAKLEWVAQQNLHRVNTHANVDLTTIAESDLVKSCSSSSDASSIEDIDGKLENIISLSSKDNVPSPKPTPKVSLKSQESITVRSNTNANSQKLTKLRAHNTKVAYLGNVPKKKIKTDVVASISPFRPQSKLNKVNELSCPKTNTPSGRRKMGTPPCFATSPLNSQHSPFPVRIAQSPINLLRNGSRSKKESTISCPAIPSQKHKRMSDKCLERSDTELKRMEPTRVKSLCGSHSTKVTVRQLRSDDM